MRRIRDLLIILFVLASYSMMAQTNVLKPRIINMTDIGGDPDDEQSMVHFLVQSNEYDVEGLIVTTGCWKKYQSGTTVLNNILTAYGKVLPNLRVHSPDYPSLAYLKSVSALGQQGYGMGNVGSGKDTPGSELVISAVDKDDPRPIWICFWGGGNTLAQAIWKVKNTRSASEFQKFISKIRIYDVLGQDDAGTWIAKNFPDIIYIRATGVYGWQPTDSWLATNVQSHGDLGAVYPNRKYAIEGDSPSFMHLYPNGLNNPDEVWQGGWGGRFERNKKSGIRGMSCMDGEDAKYDTYYMYGNTSAAAGDISRWKDSYNNDFQARMDWSITSNYSGANHHPIAIVNDDDTRQVLEIEAQAGTNIKLSAVGSTDPDGQTLSYKWYFYKDPGTYNGTVTVQGNATATPTIQVPSGANGKEIHIILELTDAGNPKLTAYRRVIINATNEVVDADPVVSITTPSNGASFQEPANVSISANASDADGSITRVEFYNGTTKIGEDATAPYSYNWTNIKAGSYSLFAKATDNKNNTTTSTAVNITVKTSGSTTTYSLTTSVTGQGSISPSSGTYKENEMVSLIATPASGWHFINWSGDANGTSSTTTIKMDGDKSVTANFEADETVGGCDSPVTISTPFSKNGAGEYCWQTTDDIAYVNSWNLEKLEINGVDYTNTWASEMPPKQEGHYNIQYVAEYSWGHLDIASTKSQKAKESIAQNTSDLDANIYPNPVGNQLNIQFSREISEPVDIYLLDATGKIVLTSQAKGTISTLEISALASGIYQVMITGTNLNLHKCVVKK